MNYRQNIRDRLSFLRRIRDQGDRQPMNGMKANIRAWWGMR